MTAKDTKDASWDVLWAVQKSQRYHSRRTAFFDRWNKTTALVGILGGSTAFAAVGKYVPETIGTIAAAFVVVMSGVDLVASTGEMARRHNDLRRRFCELEAEIRQCAAVEDTVVASWQGKRLSIESDEPPTYVALDLLCENELARAYAHLSQSEPRHKVPWYMKRTAHFIRWENA